MNTLTNPKILFFLLKCFSKKKKYIHIQNKYMQRAILFFPQLIEYSKQKQKQTSKCKRQINSSREFAFIVFQNAFYGIKKVLLRNVYVGLCRSFSIFWGYWRVYGSVHGTGVVRVWKGPQSDSRTKICQNSQLNQDQKWSLWSFEIKSTSKPRSTLLTPPLRSVLEYHRHFLFLCIQI